MTLEEVHDDALVVRIAATPERPSDAPRLAGEVVTAVTTQMVNRNEEMVASGDHEPAPNGP